MKGWWQRHFLLSESIVACVIVALIVAWSERMDGWASLDTALQGHRVALYGTVATLAGSLLGFVIAAFAIAIAPMASVRMQLVRSSGQVAAVVRIFTAASVVLGVATLLSLAGLVLDDDSSPNGWIFYATLTSIALSVVSLSRCVWALHSIVSIVVGPSRARLGTE